MTSSTDATETLLAFVFGGIELTKVVAGSLLLLTVPIMCDGHICSPYDMILDPMAHAGNTITFIAIMLNFSTLVIALAHYIILFVREHLMIELLEEDRNVAINRLHDVLDSYPIISKRLRRINATAFVSSLLFLVSTVLNTFFSGFVVFGGKFE